MLMKHVLVALMGLGAICEATALHRAPNNSRVMARQNFGKGKGGGKGNGGNRGKGKGGGNNNNGGKNNNNNNNNNNGGNNGGNGASNTCLAANALQTGSAATGQNGGDVTAGQVNSKTDNANFINFCSGQTLTNGAQITSGSCNGIPMGKIPAKDKMVSTVITSPGLLEDLPANQDFDVAVKVANMQLGSFTNAKTTYYSAPQDLSAQGTVIGHTHVTIQDTGNGFTFNQPLDASTFVFFKGINDAGDGSGGLKATVTGGLPAGNYRVCTMSGASNHQPVLMPVAQRGSQEDCRYFTVGKGGGNNGGGNNGGGNNGGGNNNNNGGGNQGKNNGGGNQGKNNGGNQGKNNGGNQGKNNGAANNGAANNGGQGKNNGGGGRGKGKGGFGRGKGNGNSAANSDATPTTSANTGKDSGAAEVATSAAAAATSSAAGNTGKGGGAGANAGGAGAGSALGGISAPAVQDTGDATRPFSVNGNTFVGKAAAVQRACAIQNNACADAVNGGKMEGVTVAQCNQQEAACRAAAGA